MASALSCIGGMDFDWIEPYSGQLNTGVSVAKCIRREHQQSDM